MATTTAFPEILRIEVMDLDAGEVAVVAQLDRMPSKVWVDRLRQGVGSTPGLEEVVVRPDGYWLFFVGFGSALGPAMHNRVAQLIAQASVSGRNSPTSKTRAGSRNTSPTKNVNQPFPSGSQAHAAQL